MGYEIELSFDLSLENVVKHKLVWKANLCLCENHWLQYDLQGRRKQIFRIYLKTIRQCFVHLRQYYQHGNH